MRQRHTYSPKVSVLLNLLFIITRELTFENVTCHERSRAKLSAVKTHTFSKSQLATQFTTDHDYRGVVKTQTFSKVSPIHNLRCLIMGWLR